MNQKEFDASTNRIIDLCYKVMASKGAAYTIGSVDRLANFKRVSQAVGITPLQVWATFFEKQVSAVMHYVNDPRGPQSEPIESRIVDIISYAFLGWGLIQEEEFKNMNQCAMEMPKPPWAKTAPAWAKTAPVEDNSSK